MNPETTSTSRGQAKTCQNCRQSFVIEPEDFTFYEKIKVPPPTFCPECRLQRRLVWMKGLRLFNRKCDLCGEMKLSMYEPEAPYLVYCDRCWWSDGWDARDFGREYDPSRPFLEQFRELLRTTPLLGLSIDKTTSELSPYSNHTGQSKNCYLIYYSDASEDCAHGCYIDKCKNVYDCTPIMDCENCYDSGNCFKNYNCAYTFQARQNVDCKFLSYSGGCTNCFASTNLKNKSYVFLNEQLTKEEYQKKVGEIDLGSYKVYEYWKDKARDHWKKYPPRPAYDDFSVDCEGSSYIFESKNCKDSFEVVGAEDCRFLDLIASGNVKDTYDLTQFGANLDMVYDSCEIGKDARDIQFSFNSGLDLMDVRYSAFLTSTAHHFGCVSVRKSEYCILNKQYSKEEFDVLKKRIIKDMEENPYVSKEGHVYKYGEFFPPEFSPHAYNGTFANFFFPLSKEDVLKKGLRWLEPEEKEYKVTIVAKDLPDNIKDVEDSLLKDVIGCMKCKRGFRVIKKELEFLRSNCLPLPRNCPFCRIGEKIELWIKNRKLIDRVCDKCGVDFKTYCDKERAPHVLCKKCYLAEVV